MIKGPAVEKYQKPTYKSYEEIKEDNARLRQVKKYQRVLMLHALMPKSLRKTEEKQKATMSIH